MKNKVIVLIIAILFVLIMSICSYYLYTISNKSTDSSTTNTNLSEVSITVDKVVGNIVYYTVAVSYTHLTLPTIYSV